MCFEWIGVAVLRVVEEVEADREEIRDKRVGG